MEKNINKEIGNLKRRITMMKKSIDHNEYFCCVLTEGLDVLHGKIKNIESYLGINEENKNETLESVSTSKVQ
jgi:hypothetical protein